MHFDLGLDSSLLDEPKKNKMLKQPLSIILLIYYLLNAVKHMYLFYMSTNMQIFKTILLLNDNFKVLKKTLKVHEKKK